MIKGLIIFLSLSLAYPVLCFPDKVRNAYIEIDKKLVPINDAIEQVQGKLERTEKSTVFRAYVADKECSVDLSEMNNGCMAEIFPNRVYVKIDFVNVKPKKEIYIDTTAIASTDSEGQRLGQVLYLIPGIHNIELKNGYNVVDVSEIKIKTPSLVKCADRNKMTCSIIE